MHKINELTTSKQLKPHTQVPRTTTGKEITAGALNDTERLLVNEFFAHMKTIYGTKWMAQFATPEAVSHAKREWAHNIAALGRQQIVRIVALLKTRIDEPELSWPNIGAILKINTSISPNGSNSQAYKPFKQQAIAKSGRERGNAELARLKSIFD